MTGCSSFLLAPKDKGNMELSTVEPTYTYINLICLYDISLGPRIGGMAVSGCLGMKSTERAQLPIHIWNLENNIMAPLAWIIAAMVYVMAMHCAMEQAAI
jgi:hypothetical protein